MCQYVRIEWVSQWMSIKQEDTHTTTTAKNLWFQSFNIWPIVAGPFFRFFRYHSIDFHFTESLNDYSPHTQTYTHTSIHSFTWNGYWAHFTHSRALSLVRSLARSLSYSLDWHAESFLHVEFSFVESLIVTLIIAAWNATLSNSLYCLVFLCHFAPSPLSSRPQPFSYIIHILHDTLRA